VLVVIIFLLYFSFIETLPFSEYFGTFSLSSFNFFYKHNEDVKQPAFIKAVETH
jgi:hypothetical protein